MPRETTLTGTLQVGQLPDGTDAIIIATSPFEQFVVPLPDDLPPGAPEGAASAREIVKQHLNKGIVLPSDGAAIVPGR